LFLKLGFEVVVWSTSLSRLKWRICVHLPCAGLWDNERGKQHIVLRRHRILRRLSRRSDGRARYTVWNHRQCPMSDMCTCHSTYPCAHVPRNLILSADVPTPYSHSLLHALALRSHFTFHFICSLSRPAWVCHYKTALYVSTVHPPRTPSDTLSSSLYSPSPQSSPRRTHQPVPSSAATPTPNLHMYTPPQLGSKTPGRPVSAHSSPPEQAHLRATARYRMHRQIDILSRRQGSIHRPRYTAVRYRSTPRRSCGVPQHW
jgi:hypothetical protein